MTETQNSEAPPGRRDGKNRKRRPLLILLGIIALLTGGLLFSMTGDDALEPYDDLILPAPKRIPDQDNAYFHLVAAGRSVQQPGPCAMTDIHMFLLGHPEAAETLPTPGDIKKFFASNKIGLAHLERAIQARGSLFESYSVSYDSLADLPLEALFSAFELGLAHCAHLSVRGETRRSLDAYLDLVRVAYKMEQNCGSAWEYLSALSKKSWVLEYMMGLAAEMDSAPPDFKAHVAALDRLRTDPGNLTKFLRREFAFLIPEYLAIAEDRRSFGLPGGSWPRCLAFKPNRTINALAHDFRNEIAALEVSIAPPGRVWPEDTLPRIALYLSGNVLGFALLSENYLGYDVIRNREHRVDLALDASRVILAIRMYESQHSALPMSLQDLVPEYFDSVPRDPFDGQALRYSRKDRFVYSIGEDLFDAGGDPETGGRNEPTFSFARE